MLRYEVTARYAKDYEPIKGFPGLAVRGALGYALHTLYCASPGTPCHKCPRRPHCPYAILYETTPDTYKGADIATKTRFLTNPMTLEVLFNTPREIGYAVNLFGDATRLHREVIIAALHMANLGLGYSKRHVERRRLTVQRITQVIPEKDSRQTIYDGAALNPSLLPKKPPKSLLAAFAKQASKIAEARPTHLQVRFTAPYRIGASKPTYTPPLPRLLMNIARRYSVLAAYHRAGRRLSLRDARTLKSLAAKAEIIEASHGPLIQVTKRDLATGSRKSYGLFAAHGKILYRLPSHYWDNPLAPLSAALILAGQYLHAGKLATAGYGKYEAKYL